MRDVAAVLALAHRADRRAARRLVALHALLLVNTGLVAAALKVLVDAATTGSGGRALVGVACGFVALAGGIVLIPVGAVVAITLEERIGAALDRRLIELSAGFPTLDVHDRNDYAEKLQLLANDDRFPITTSISTVFSLSTYAALVVGTSAVLGAQRPLLALTPLAIGPMVWIGWRADGLWGQAQVATASDQRLAHELFRLVTTPQAGKELRLFGSGGLLVARHAAAEGRVLDALSRASWRGAVLRAASWGVFGTLYALTVLTVTHRAIRGEATAGDVILVISLSLSVVLLAQGTSSALFALSRLSAAGSRLRWMDAHASASTAGRPAPESLGASIRLEGVGFSYPGTESAALEGVDLDLPAGSVVALVGENGAGKSTLVKLLCGLYAPAAGRVLVDGVDLAEIDVRAWRARVCATFQDFLQLEVLASESVGVGDLPRVQEVAARERAVDEASARFVLARLPEGWETQLGRSWTEGVELSTGQWQKLALSRGLMRDDPLLVVLDEPTSSLDPMAEHQLFEQFSRLATAARSTSAVTVIVSHRFSTAQLADLIVVIDGGRLTAAGTHRELLAQGGTYAELYGIQSAGYA